MRTFHFVMIKPSHCDDDGYVIRWFRSVVPSNSLAAIYGLAADSARRKALGEDVRMVLAAYDETNTRIDLGRNRHLHNWLDMAKTRIQFQGLPARICWVGLGDRHRLGLAFNEMVAKGEVKAPIVIGRDHLDSGSVASPNRETEAMQDGSDAVSDWPLLNALLNCASGATWVSLHHGGGVGIGYSQHAGMVIVADGTPAAARRLERVLTNDPASGVMRHADAGYEIAIDCAKKQGLKLPMLGS